MNGVIHTRGVDRRTVLFSVLMLAMFLAAVSGCTSPARFTPAVGAENFPPYEGEVRVLENLPSSGRFKRVGVVIVEGVQLTSDGAMMGAAKREAAANGADAIVLQAPIKSTRESSGTVRKTLGAWAIRLER